MFVCSSKSYSFKGWGLTQLVVSLSQGSKHSTWFYHTYSSHTPKFTVTRPIFCLLLCFVIVSFCFLTITTQFVFLAFCIGSLSYFPGPPGPDLCLLKCLDRAVTLKPLPYLLIPSGLDPYFAEVAAVTFKPFLFYFLSPLGAGSVFCRGGYIYTRHSRFILSLT